MKLAVIGMLIGAAGVAHANNAVFDEYSDVIPQRSAQQLFEMSCDLQIELRGAVATFELRQRIVNPGPDALAASLELALPRGAQVTRFALGSEPGLVVAATSPSIEGASPVLGVDPAVLERDGDADTYRVILQPIAPGHEVRLTTGFVAIAEPRAGAMRLVLPGRSAPKLTACRGTIRARPGPGAVVRKIRVGDRDAGRSRGTFVVDTADLTIDVELDVPGRTPIAWRQTQALADGWQASLVTVLGPRVKPAGTRRVVLVIDGSRSMELVGRHHVTKVIRRIGAALPAGAELEAIIYDRTATRVFGALRPASPDNVAAIEAAVAARPAGNGSDVVAAFARAHEVVAGVRGQAMVIVISDGVTGDVRGADLIRALGGKPTTVDVHAIVLDPATTSSPGAEILRAPVNLFGGAFVEVKVDQLDDALASIEEWLRPAWLELALGAIVIPKEVRAGAGFTQLTIHTGTPRLTLTGHGARTFTVPVRAAPAAPIGVLALARAPELADLDPSMLARARALRPAADRERSFAVLTRQGRVARSRREVVRGGGRYERMIALADPIARLAAPSVTTQLHASAIARDTLERLFRDQLQPMAYRCYQRALGRNAKLGGTAHFTFRMGRGEVTAVELTGLGDAPLDGCLLDAAYQLTPPLPDFTRNADDQTIANYPLTFQRRADQAVIVLGDADSSSPLDIDGIEGGLPGRARPIKIDKANTTTPLGTMRPPRSP